MGDGGCIARALVAIGVFAAVEDATQGLDTALDWVHENDPNHKNKPRAKAGIPGVTWHMDVVRRAVKQAHPNHTLRKLDLEEKRTTWHTFRCGTLRRFLFIGTLSPSFVCKRDNTRGKQSNGGGSHCIAVVYGRVVCRGERACGEQRGEGEW